MIDVRDVLARASARRLTWLQVAMLARLMVRVELDGECWVWLGSTINSGYGNAGDGRGRGKHSLVHRLVYELLAGPIPVGHELDHLCERPLCVRPDHLEPVTRLEHNRRTGSRKTTCIHGHVYDETTTYRRARGSRECRRCHADRQRARRSA